MTGDLEQVERVLLRMRHVPDTASVLEWAERLDLALAALRVNANLTRSASQATAASASALPAQSVISLE